MTSAISKREKYPPLKPEGLNFYHKNFALALLNWEINRQEERLAMLKTITVSK